VRFVSDTGRNFVQLTKMEESGVRINCYAPGASDEMHCHPGSEHSFVVWQGKLHVTGVEDGEDITVGPGEFVQIDAGYYYRLHNPGPEAAVYVQFHSIRAKGPGESTVLFSQSARGKRAAAAQGGRG
jgi:mannose-6-phosphate isomerase-like protein (cupin superfamily)